MSDAMVAGVDYEPLHPSNGAVGGKHVLAPAHLDLAHRHAVICHQMANSRPVPAQPPAAAHAVADTHPVVPAHAVIGPGEHLFLPITGLFAARDELRLFC